jgi:hypothetical protein
MEENLNLNEIRGKYRRLKAEIFYIIEQNPEYGHREVSSLKKAINRVEQDCLERGIKKDNPIFTYEKTANILHIFKTKLAKEELQRKYLVQWALASSGHTQEESEIIKGIMRRTEEGKLAKLVKVPINIILNK